MSSFSLVLSDGTTRDYFDGFIFCRQFRLDKDELKCGKLNPQLRYKNEMVGIIHFTDFRFVNGSFIFIPEVINLSCPDNVKVEFTILTPRKIKLFLHMTSRFNYCLVPIPMPSSINTTLENENKKVYYHIFFKSPQSNDLEYVKSATSIFNGIFQIAEKAIIEAGHGLFGVKIGIKTDLNADPSLLIESNFLKTSARLKKRILIIVVTSEKKRTFSYVFKILY